VMLVTVLLVEVCLRVETCKLRFIFVLCVRDKHVKCVNSRSQCFSVETL